MGGQECGELHAAGWTTTSLCLSAFGILARAEQDTFTRFDGLGFQRCVPVASSPFLWPHF